jgi:hypothetical protein
MSYYAYIPHTDYGVYNAYIYIIIYYVLSKLNTNLFSMHIYCILCIQNGSIYSCNLHTTVNCHSIPLFSLVEVVV